MRDERADHTHTHTDNLVLATAGTSQNSWDTSYTGTKVWGVQALLAQLKGQRCDGPRAQGLNTCLERSFMTTADSRYSFPLLPSLILVLLHVRMTAKSACQSELTLTPLLPSTPEYVAVKWRNKKGAGGKERRWEGGEKGKQVQRGRAPRYTNRKPFGKILRTSPSSTFYFFVHKEVLSWLKSRLLPKTAHMKARP